MTISMHSASVPIFARMLGNLLTWLDKAEAHATARKFDPSVYLSSRLAPDMLPFAASGVSYSPYRNAFYVWHWDCGTAVLADAISRFGFDYRK